VTERPPAAVVDDAGSPSAAAALPTGWTVVPMWDLPAEPFDLSPERLAVVARVWTSDDAREVLLAAARGVAAVIEVRLPADAADQFLDDLGRLTTPAATMSTAALERDHLELLRALAAGATLTSAAKELGLSRRTAVRRIGEARERLGVATTAEAVARIDAAPASGD
jgi:DNA-binding NarL/FixJ family response regulator